MKQRVKRELWPEERGWGRMACSRGEQWGSSVLGMWMDGLAGRAGGSHSLGDVTHRADAIFSRADALSLR